MQDDNRNIEIILKNLNERKKELECIYQLDELFKNFDADLHKVFEKLCEIIPLGWRFPEFCIIRIESDGIVVQSEGFKNTEFKKHSELLIDELSVGSITLCYTKKIFDEKDVFLAEENRLFTTIVQKTNQYLSFRKLKEIYADSIDCKYRISINDRDFIGYLKSMHLTNAEIDIITKVQIDFNKGETICKQGSFASFVMILKTGLVKAFVENAHSKNHIFKFTKPYNIIGLSSLFGDDYYHFSCQAIVPSRLYLIERDNLYDIIKSNPAFAIEVMKINNQALQMIYDKLGSVANKQAIGKVCDSLLYLSEKVFESNTIDTTITRKDIADFSGLATENLVRILSELKKDNIISINNKNIEILNLETLKMLSNFG